MTWCGRLLVPRSRTLKARGNSSARRKQKRNNHRYCHTVPNTCTVTVKIATLRDVIKSAKNGVSLCFKWRQRRKWINFLGCNWNTEKLCALHTFHCGFSYFCRASLYFVFRGFKGTLKVHLAKIDTFQQRKWIETGHLCLKIKYVHAI